MSFGRFSEVSKDNPLKSLEHFGAIAGHKRIKSSLTNIVVLAGT